MIAVGIDAGSRAIKIVVLDSRKLAVLASGCADQGLHQDKLAGELLKDVLGRAGLARRQLGRCVATGYARGQISAAASTVTEITCHARGVQHLLPQARTVIDIGGQDSKVIWLKPGGGVQDFVMNDRCAAGTGRFLELVACRLAADNAEAAQSESAAAWSLGELGRLAAAARAPAAISSMCAVFAETEIIGMLASGGVAANIAAGVQQAVARRIAALIGRNIAQPVIFTGGVALMAGMRGALEKILACPVAVAPDPQMTGALGAAILAAKPA